MNAGILRLERITGTGIAGLEVSGSEAGALIKRYTENGGRAVIQSNSGAHLNDIERTRFTMQTAYTAVPAFAFSTDAGFRIPAGKILKVWYVTGISDGTANEFLTLNDILNSQVIDSRDATARADGDPSAASPLVTYTPAGGVAANVQCLRDNSANAGAHTFTGTWVLSIE